MTQAGEMALNAGAVGSGKFESFRLNHCASSTRKALLLTPPAEDLGTLVGECPACAALEGHDHGPNARGWSAESLAGMAYARPEIGSWLVWGAENTATGRENPWSLRAGITHAYASGNSQGVCEVQS